MDTQTFAFASWEGSPAVIVGDRFAYVFEAADGRWQEVHAADVAHEGVAMTEDRFRGAFPKAYEAAGALRAKNAPHAGAASSTERP
jgi:hypothetical protein